MTTASDSLGSFSMARVARRSTSVTRSVMVSPLGGRWPTRRSRSWVHSTMAAASRWSFDEK